jgi:uncharacterized protein (DUF2345 family)
MASKKREIPEDLAVRLFLLAERNSRSEELEMTRSGNTTLISMAYEKNGIRIVTRAISCTRTDGESHVKVTAGAKVVLEARGIYIDRPAGLRVMSYIPGDWEKVFKRK